MEERIIDDEYGRGVRLKKTKDGYVDVTDELAASKEEIEDAEADEVTVEFPMLNGDKDDEDLVGLSPEEAAALIKRKEEEAAKRKAKYDETCAKGEELLCSGAFEKAEKVFEKALQLDELATVASVGDWRAKTQNFPDPDVLIAEYANSKDDSPIESLEYDLGLEATDVIKEQYKGALEKRVAELEEEEKPLAEEVEGKQEKRRSVLVERLKKATAAFAVTMLLFAAAVVLTVVFACKIPTVRDSLGYIVATAVCGGLSLVTFIVFLVFTKKFIDALRMHLKNEKLSSTDDGLRLQTIRSYKALYLALLAERTQETDEDEEDENDEDDE